MVITMIAMRMVQASVHEVVDVVTMGDGFVPAGRAMSVRADGFWCALHRIDRVDCDDMLINVIRVWMMQMAIM
jgi:hypothetical protein